MREKEPRYFERMSSLSRSSIWHFMRKFYNRRGITAWTEGTVPSQVSNHSGIAYAYAKLAAAWLDDLVQAGAVTRDQTVYALELGSGTGRLAYGFARHYERLRLALNLPRICYVVSDFTETNIDAHRRNPGFRQLVGEGLIDFCTFDAQSPKVPFLVESRQKLTDALADSPLLVLANYFFDSLPHDFFRVQNGVLQEGFVSLSSEGGEPEYETREQIKDVKLHFHYARADRPRYDEHTLEDLITFYSELDDCSVLFPIHGLRCLDSLNAMAKGRLLLLTADKASVHAEELAGDREPFVAHHGSFSVTANYHALTVYAKQRDAQVFVPPPRDGTMTYCVLRFDDRDIPTTRLSFAFDETMLQASPTDLHILSWHMQQGAEKPTMEYCLALLRATGADPITLTRLETEMMVYKKDASYKHREELAIIIERAAEVYLHLRHDDVFIPCLARLLRAFDEELALTKIVKRLSDIWGDQILEIVSKALESPVAEV